MLNLVSRRSCAIHLVASLAASSVLFLTTDAAFAAPLSTVDWENIKQDATTYVSNESPSTVNWFHESGQINRSKTVIAHYFPVFPLSIDNKPTKEDYYAQNFLSPTGENGKFAKMGGYLRERPLPVSVWPGNRAAETNLAIEILRAQRIGIDAFGVDLLSINSGKAWTTALQLLDVSEHVSPTFKIAAEPDMAALKTATVEDLATALTTFAKFSRAYRLSDGRLLIIPFKAEARPPEFWESLESTMAQRGVPIAFFPDFLDTSKARDFSKVSAGVTFWGGRDPASASSQLTLARNLSNAVAKQVIMPVSAQDFRPKSFMSWESRNTEAYRTQWQAALSSDYDYIHLITWNDYSETSELSPSSKTQFVYYDLSAYYISWFKRGHAPTIDKDVLFYSYREQIFNPHVKTSGPSFRMVGKTPLSNDIELVALLRSPAELEIEIGGVRTRQRVGAGMQILRMPAAPGTPHFSILRNNISVKTVVGAWPIVAQPTQLSALYSSGSSNRNIVAAP